MSRKLSGNRCRGNRAEEGSGGDSLKEAKHSFGQTFPFVRLMERTKGEPWKGFSGHHGDWGRNLILALASRYGLRLKPLAVPGGGLEYVTLSVAIPRFEDKIEKDQHVAKIFLNVKS